MTLILLLSASSLLAGFIDAVVGGGGLIQIPAMLILLPGAPVATILGTNKFASFAGTTIAVQRYARHVAIDWATVLPAALTAFVFSFLGSRTVTLLQTEFMRPIVLVLLVLVAIYVFFVKDLGLIHRPPARAEKSEMARRSYRRRPRVLRRLLRTGHGQLSHFSFRRSFRVRFSLGLGLSQGDQLGHQYRLGHLFRVEREHSLPIRRANGSLQRHWRDDRDQTGERSVNECANLDHAAAHEHGKEIAEHGTRVRGGYIEYGSQSPGQPQHSWKLHCELQRASDD